MSFQRILFDRFYIDIAVKKTGLEARFHWIDLKQGIVKVTFKISRSTCRRSCSKLDLSLATLRENLGLLGYIRNGWQFVGWSHERLSMVIREIHVAHIIFEQLALVIAEDTWQAMESNCWEHVFANYRV